MTLLTLMDALQVHAAAAAITAGGTAFTDVAVGFPVAKGRCVRIFYGGEAAPPHMADEGQTLGGTMVGQKITVRGYWPNADTGVNTQRGIEGELATFVSSLRTRVMGDFQLGGAAESLKMEYADPDYAIIGSTKYRVVDADFIVQYDDYAWAP